MAMGVVSDEEFTKQLDNVTNVPSSKPPTILPSSIDIPTSDVDNSNNPVIEGEVVELKSRGRSIGDVNVPASLRCLIAGTAHIEGRQAALEVANEFGVSSSSVSAYSKGVHSTKDYDDSTKVDPDIVGFVRARKARVTKKALRVMTSSLNLLTPEKLMTAKAKDLAGIASDMSKIIGNFSDQGDVINNNGPTFVLYSPPVIEEKHFNAIQSTE